MENALSSCGTPVCVGFVHTSVENPVWLNGAASVGAAGASAAGWEKISRDRLGNTAEATTVVTGSSVIAAWTYASGPGTSSIEAVTFSASLTDAVQNPVTVPVVSDWTNLNTDPPFDRKPGDKPALDDAEIKDVVAFLTTLRTP